MRDPSGEFSIIGAVVVLVLVVVALYAINEYLFKPALKYRAKLQHIADTTGVKIQHDALLDDKNIDNNDSDAHLRSARAMWREYSKLDFVNLKTSYINSLFSFYVQKVTSSAGDVTYWILVKKNGMPRYMLVPQVHRSEQSPAFQSFDSWQKGWAKINLVKDRVTISEKD